MTISVVPKTIFNIEIKEEKCLFAMADLKP